MPRGGSNRKSRRQHELDGTFRADRHAGESPAAGGVPIKPDDLTGRAGELWDAIEPQMVEWGCGEIDSFCLGDMCRWWARYRELNEASEVRKSLAAYRVFLQLAAKYGLTPADRARLDLTARESAEEREARNYGYIA